MNMDNSFDQMCINYTNERFQHYFVDIMLVKEKQWYDSQKLNVPFVPFFDNSPIIGTAFEDKYTNYFKTLI